MFYKDYTNPPYREILEKKGRAYNCLLFQTHYGYFICVPYRTEITHTYAYHFKNSGRSVEHKSGLDYTKIIIVKNSDYIDKKSAIIDKDEYKETMQNFDRIKKEVLRYVEEYIAHVRGTKILYYKEYERRYKFSTLPYFHKELGINN